MSQPKPKSVRAKKVQKPQQKQNIAEDHCFTDGNDNVHPFIMYSTLIGSYKFSFNIQNLFRTLEKTYTYQFGKGWIVIPKYHLLVQYLPTENNPKDYNGSKNAIELIVILMDDHIGRTQMFKYSEVEIEFNAQFILALPDIAEFASLYEIQPVFDYIENLLTLTNNFSIYRPSLRKFCNGKRPSYIKNLFARVLDKAEKKLDVDLVYDNVFSTASRYLLYDKFVYETTYGKNGFNGMLSLFHEFLINDLDEIKTQPSRSINIYQLINMASYDKPARITSKFLHYFLSRPDRSYLDTKKIKPLCSDFDEYYSLKLPTYLNKLVKLNLLILSMNDYDKTPRHSYYKEEKEELTTF